MTIERGAVWAIIPARSGSSVKDKNIRSLAGHPMISYSIAVAKMVPEISRVIVSTDSEEYATISRHYGAEVPFIRPKDISGSKSTDIEFMEHAIGWFKQNEGTLPEFWVHLRPTTPLRDSKIVQKAIIQMKNDKQATSLRSAHVTDYCPFKWFKMNEDGYFETFDGITLDEANNPRQSFPKTYVPNGYVDIIKTEYIINNHKMHGTKMIGFEVPQVVDVDYEKDIRELNESIINYSGPVLEWLNIKKSDF